MATKKSKAGEPVVTVGSHSVRTQYPDGRVDFVVDDVKLREDVLAALAEFADATEAGEKLKWKPKHSDIATIIDSAYKWYASQ